MGDYLRTASEYTFRADIAYDEIVQDQMILFGGVAEIALLRGPDQLPDQLNVELDGDELRRRVVFDGKTITVHNMTKNLYAVMTDVPSEIDVALDRFFEVVRLLRPGRRPRLFRSIPHADRERSDGIRGWSTPGERDPVSPFGLCQGGNRLADLGRGGSTTRPPEAGYHL